MRPGELRCFKRAVHGLYIGENFHAIDNNLFVVIRVSYADDVCTLLCDEKILTIPIKHFAEGTELL